MRLNCLLGHIISRKDCRADLEQKRTAILSSAHLTRVTGIHPFSIQQWLAIVQWMFYCGEYFLRLSSCQQHKFISVSAINKKRKWLYRKDLFLLQNIFYFPSLLRSVPPYASTAIKIDSIFSTAKDSIFLINKLVSNPFFQKFLKMPISFFSRKNASNLERFQLAISKKELYKENDPTVDALLKEMATRPIVHAGKFEQSNYLIFINLSFLQNKKKEELNLNW